MRVRRVTRHIVAPVVAGGLAAAGLFAVADADMLPIGSVGSTAQGQDDAEGEPTIDDVIARGVGYDTEAVFRNATLGKVGEFFTLYTFGAPTTVDVASSLRSTSDELLADDPTDAVITEREAAQRFLLSHQCNAAQTLAIRQQVTRPVLATIMRPDEELRRRLEAFFSGDATLLPPGTTMLSQSQVNALRSSVGLAHAPPLVSDVQVGSVTVSVLDFDLWRAHDDELLGRLLRPDGTLARLVGSTDVARVLADPLTAYRALMESCLDVAGEVGTKPYVQTLRGHEVLSVKLGEESVFGVESLLSRDVVNWVESTEIENVALDVRVLGDFSQVADNLRINTAVDFSTRDYLQLRADTVEPALEVAWAIVGREFDPLDVLRRVAFAPLPGFAYDEPSAGAEAAVMTDLRRASERLDPLLLQERLQASGNLASQLRTAEARAVMSAADIDANLRRRYSTPTNPDRLLPDAVLQALFWEPEFMSSDAFRSGWRRGIHQDVTTIIDRGSILDTLLGVVGIMTAVEPLPVPARDHVLQQVLLERLGILDAAGGIRDGTARIHTLAPCFTATVVSPDQASALRVADLAVDAQRTERQVVFGIVVDRAPAAEAGDEVAEGADGGERPFARAADEAEARLRALLGELGVTLEAVLDDIRQAPSEEVLEADLRGDRAAQDAVRTARCSRANLDIHLRGEPVIDLDRNGIHDELPENEVASPARS